MTVVNLELTISHHINASPETVWKIMTERLPEWWCPIPWRAELNAVEWQSGGRFDITLYGPQGEVIPSQGVLLEVIPGQRMVFTDAFDATWQPQGPFMVGIIEINAENGGTRYTGRARHWTEAALQQHREMGFETGWSAVAVQLANLAQAVS